jgi:hypothetical protein
MNKIPSLQQWRRFKLWLDNDCNVKATAKADGSQPEIIRKAIAAVHWHLKKSKT